jgi:integrase
MINATAAIVLDKRIVSKGNKFATKLRVTYNRQQKYYFLREHLTVKQWESIQGNRARGEFKKLGVYFKIMETRANDLIRDLHPFTFDIFEYRYFSRPVDHSNFLDIMQEYIDRLLEEERIGSARCYETALRSIKRFATNNKKKKIYFEDITVEWLNRYEKWMIGNGNSPSTVGIYTRNIRAIINVGIERRLLNRESYPFGRNKYIIPVSRNVKKALKLEEIKKIFDYEPITEAEEQAKDIWMFSYLCNGANIKDICLLRYKDIDEDSIQFIRAKTVNTRKSDIKPIRVLLLPEIKTIIRKWGGQTLDPNAYVFGFIKPDSTALYIDDRVHDITRLINKYMKRIGKKLELSQSCTTYTARHSFATVLKNKGISTEFISESLGHSSLSTTAHYLGSFEDETKLKNQKMLLDF